MKCSNKKLDLKWLEKRASRAIQQGFSKQKWIEFSEKFCKEGYELTLYEARKTKSKYITLRRYGKEFKVRFSDHMPSKVRELNGDCDFFVGRTHTGIRSTQDAIKATRKFFKESYL
jgi:hypothetical protein